MLVVDVDRFKSVNDAHGHEIGDRVLQELAARLRGVSPDPGLAFRLGGEEFAILLPGADRELAQARGEQLRAAVRGRPVCGLPVTVSVGVAVREAGVADSVTRVLAHADEALYEAKRSGRDRVVLAGERFSPTPPAPVPIPALDQRPSAWAGRNRAVLHARDLRTACQRVQAVLARSRRARA